MYKAEVELIQLHLVKFFKFLTFKNQYYLRDLFLNVRNLKNF